MPDARRPDAGSRHPGEPDGRQPLVYALKDQSVRGNGENSSAATGPSIRVVGEEVGAGGRVALVRTMVGAKDGTEVRFDYVMTKAARTGSFTT
jgi:hypothetical protein